MRQHRGHRQDHGGGQTRAGADGDVQPGPDGRLRPGRRLLLELSQPEGDVRVIRDTLTQQDIADRVGASREMVSRILKDLREGGYIEIHARHITLRESLPHGW
jgi:CRP-like cAMP-binding protein